MAKPADRSAVAALDPQPVWKFFAAIAAVPRPSKKEAQIRAFMRETATRLGFAVREDRVGNMVVEVPATKGYERTPVTVLQGHLDMVCEQNSDTHHDFDRDGIRLVLDRDKQGEPIVRADQTTLGADNGIGVAMALAAASEPDVVHGPLEILCTIDEEQGMTGAKVLAPDFFRGRRLINLDSEEDAAIYIGCAGGCDTTLTWELPTSDARGDACRVTVAGLKGGHSGGDIHLNRGSAIKLLVRTLRGADQSGLRLVDLAGGSKRNAIPREASAVVVGPAGLADALRKTAATVQNEVRQYTPEDGCTITVDAATAVLAASAEDSQRVLATLAALPHGVLAVVPEIAGLVETSNSTSTVESTTENGRLRVVVGCLSRSSSRPQLHSVVRQLAAVGELAGAQVASGNEYPGWQPNVDSPLLATCRRLYAELFGAEAKVTAIHAGLECGLIGERIGEGQLDMVSFGPRIEGAHSPDERVWVNSVQKSYRFLTAVLAELARG